MSKITEWKEQWQSSLANAYAPGEFIDEDIIYKLLLANISSDEHVTPQSEKRYALMNLVEKLNSLAEDTAPNVTNKVLYLKNIKLADNLPDTILTFIAEVTRKSLTVYEIDSLLDIPTADQTIIYKELLKKISSDTQI